MLQIDGSYGEGGGQVLRTSLAMSAYSGTSFRLKNIRANRSNPGLSHQHVKCVEFMEKLTDARVSGKKLGSLELVFKPNNLVADELEVDIGTAGSVTLLLQTVLPLLPKIQDGLVISVRGGTDVKWSPLVDYFRKITLYYLNRIGLNCSLEVTKRGYYPKGGGSVRFVAKPSDLRGFSFVDEGDWRDIRGISFSSNLPNHVAERQKKAVLEELGQDLEVEIVVNRDSGAIGKGSGVFLWAEDSKGNRLGASALGERGKPAEEVGEEAVSDLIYQMNKEGCVDRYLGDQLIPFLAMAKDSMINVVEVTSHTSTNAWVVNRFLDTGLEINEVEGVISS